MTAAEMHEVPPIPAEVAKLFELMARHTASDLHLKAGSAPIFRVARTVRRMETRPLAGEDVDRLAVGLMTPFQREQYDRMGTVDFAYSLHGVGRFRINVFRQRGSTSLAARRVMFDIPTFEELHLPPGIGHLPGFEQGLVVVSGITGSGKSTTLASIINQINVHRRCHILTIEDPIEYLYKDAKSFVNQREVGIDVDAFKTALKYMVREDPDVILIGEMRDAETLETALIAAETGHLVFTTLHSSSAPQTIGRMLDFFPADRHEAMRALMYFNLKAVIVQKLLKGAKKEAPLVPSVELMIVNPSIKKAIREGEDEKIGDIIRSCREEGMQDMNQSLVDLVKSGLVTKEIALESSPNAEQLSMNLKGIFVGGSGGQITG